MYVVILRWTEYMCSFRCEYGLLIYTKGGSKRIGFRSKQFEQLNFQFRRDLFELVHAMGLTGVRKKQEVGGLAIMAPRPPPLSLSRLPFEPEVA